MDFWKNSVFSALICLSVVGQGVWAADVAMLKGKRILFLGDSITQAGTYVGMTDYYLQKTYPNETFDILGFGLSSETTSGLSEKTHPFPRPCVHNRLGKVLEQTKPDVVVACYGMNDGIYHPQSPERMKAYQDGIMKLVNACRAAGAQVILMTPTLFEPKSNTPNGDAPDFSYKQPYYRYNEVLKDYSDWIMSLKLDGISCVNLHDATSDYAIRKKKANPDFRFTGDGIHPKEEGHLVMAATLLKALGVTVPQMDDLAKELKRLKKDPLYLRIEKRRKSRSP